MDEKDLSVVIRSVSERTEELCRQRVVDNGLSEEQIRVVREVPFSKAMAVSYRLGVEADKKWTLCLDADVLLRDGALRQLMKLAEQEKADLFGLSGRLLDKLFGRERSVGNHLFRTSYLPKMITLIETFEKEQIRPETEVKNRMRALGYRWEKKPDLIGLHDFEQHPADIARKAFVHIHKHTEELSELIGFWKEKQVADNDFQVALYAASQSLLHRDRVVIDQRFYNQLTGKVQSKFPEKEAVEQVNGERIEQILADPTLRYKESDALKRKQMDQFYEQFFRKKNGTLIYTLLKKMKKELKKGFKK